MLESEIRERRVTVITKVLFILILFFLWEYLPVWTGRDKLFPPLSRVLESLWENLTAGELLQHIKFSLYLIFSGIGLGIILAFFLTAFCMISKTFARIMDVIVSIMHPLPGIALLPVVMLLVGLGTKAIIIIIIHSILWPLIVNSLAGFRAIPKIQLELGRNIGMSEFRLIWAVMIPNAFPYILSGLKIAWARSWRALVSAEMVFGASGVVGGLGWFIYKTRYFMDIESVFAGLISVIIIGMLVDEFLLKTLENKTVKKWGMST
jgi:NitT/TauT family transport system permease protein